MSEKKYDSDLIGWAEEPIRNDNNEIVAWSMRLKDHEVKDLLDNYVTAKNEQGHGGNVYLTLFMSKGGKACARVYNPNSEAAKEKRAAKQTTAAVSDDGGLPF